MNTSKIEGNNNHIETIEDKIEDTLLEIEWLIREKCHIMNSDSLEAVEKKINDAAKERGRNNFPNSSKNWFYLRVSFERQSVY